MSDDRGYPIQTGFILLLLIGGGWYFFRHYQVGGLDGLTIRGKETQTIHDYVSYTPNRSVPTTSATTDEADFTLSSSSKPITRYPESDDAEQRVAPLSRVVEAPAPPTSRPTVRRSVPIGPIIDRTYGRRVKFDEPSEQQVIETPDFVSRRYRNLRIASWAMGGFGPSKLANDMVRRTTVNVIRQFDIIAVQQITSQERDLLPRLVDALNEGQSGIQGAAQYDYILGNPSFRGVGSVTSPEQLAFIFDTQRVHADRAQTYIVSDPANRITHDPVVAWFRTAEPDPSEAWTFTLVNIRVELARAKDEVALLPNIMASVRKDGRGEDDVVLAGLFQADDAYLVPVVTGSNVMAAVQNLPTDVVGRDQTSNILVDETLTSEFLGRGGPLNFLRPYNLTVSEAEAVSPYLPVYAEFSVFEGGHL